ncbi:MAG: hypothetical protein LBP86_08040 [Azoarcus sp.]|jgi:hypothetical protein|nr:hypothetical protein [Azoarcus sp.]
MSSGRRARMVLPVWKILLMHIPFRLPRRGGAGFAPGVRASFAWLGNMGRHMLFDRDRLKYLFIRLCQFFPMH